MAQERYLTLTVVIDRPGEAVRSVLETDVGCRNGLEAKGECRGRISQCVVALCRIRKQRISDLRGTVESEGTPFDLHDFNFSQ